MQNIEFIERRKMLSDKLQKSSILILFGGQAPHRSADSSYGFTPNRNFYYITGINREKAIFVSIKKSEEVEEILFIEKRDELLEKWIGKKQTVDEAKEASGVSNIKYIDEFMTELGKILNTNEVENIYLDLERANHNMPTSFTQSFAIDIKNKYPHIVIKNIYHEISAKRMIKSEYEISCIKKAITITNEGIKNMMKNSKPGMYEYEIEAYFDFTLKSYGVRENAFNTIGASGANATILHYETNHKKTEENELILFDLGATCGHYSADISRTFPVGGRFTDRQKAIYNIVLSAQEETIKAAKPGVTLDELNDVTKRVLTCGLKEIGLIKEDSELSKYYYHRVSHHLGLDTHDVGDRQKPLCIGNVITIEPGLYIEEESIGIRIEDDILIKDSGFEVLSAEIIKTVDEIEEFMNK